MPFMPDRVSPYSFDVSPSAGDVPVVTHDSVPLGAVPLLASCTPEYTELVNRTIQAANGAYSEFIRSSDGIGFSGQVVLIGINQTINQYQLWSYKFGK